MSAASEDARGLDQVGKTEKERERGRKKDKITDARFAANPGSEPTGPGSC